jgi:tol-pal system protein YbgF
MISGFRSSLLLGVAALILLPGMPAFAQTTPGAGANYESRLESLEEEIRTLEGRVEQAEFANRKQDQILQRIQTDIDARLSHIEAALPAANAAPAPAAPPPTTNAAIAAMPPSAPSSVNNDDDEPTTPVVGTLGSIKTQGDKIVGGSVNPQQPALPPTPPDYGLTPEEQYDRAFEMLRKTDYANAEKAFKTFIDKNPQDKLAYNAKYWYGETLYVQNKYDEAAVAFADAYQQNPRGEKAPDNLLDLAKSLGALGKVPDACATLDSLKSKYPNAPLKVRDNADQARTKLKCSTIH